MLASIIGKLCRFHNYQLTKKISCCGTDFSWGRVKKKKKGGGDGGVLENLQIN